MRDARHFVHLAPVTLGGWTVKVSLHDITGMFCLVMFHLKTERCYLAYIEDESDVISAILKQVETNGN